MTGWAQHDAERMDDERDQLAAKDAEIAELRKRMGECDKLLAHAISMHASAVQQNGDLSIQLAQCVLQRDEARECIRRLYPFAAEYEAEVSAELNTDRLTPDARRKYEYQLGQVRSAIASIPESLHAD